MNQADVVSPDGRHHLRRTPREGQADAPIGYDRIAVQAWDLYNAVQVASTESLKRLAARGNSGGPGGVSAAGRSGGPARR